MKVTINKPANTIDLSDVTEDMCFVGIDVDKSPYVLKKEGVYAFYSVACFTKEEKPFTMNTSLKGCIKGFVGQDDCPREVHAFTDYKEAFKFIAENL